MSFTVISKRILKSGDIMGSRLIKSDEKDLIVDICGATKQIREKTVQMESRIENAVTCATADAMRITNQNLTLDALAKYAAQHEITSAAIKRISTQLIDSIVEALSITLTPEQTVKIFGNQILTELSSASLPAIAVRVNPELLSEFESWLSESCPETIRNKVQVFPHDNIPSDCLVLRAGSTVTEIWIKSIIFDLAHDAATSIALDLGLDSQSRLN